VKASLVGSILSNTLLGLGLAAIVGGVRHGTQRFHVESVRRAAAMMILAVSAMALPAVFAQAEKDFLLQEEVSVGIAVLLLLTYAAYVFYSHGPTRKTRRPASADSPEPPPAKPHGKAWNLPSAFALLGAAVVGTAAASELLVGAVEPVSKSIGLSPFFVGLVVVPLVGNIAEYYSAVGFAREDRMELSFSICASSSIQIAVFVAPCLVLASLVLHPMTLIFRPIELVALLSSCAIFAYVSLDAETDWLEGAQLVCLYLICAVAFFFVPR
jgi:Ca2+:H+ antiporter